MKNILFISSNNTGHGHKSITQSLLEQFAKFGKSVNVVEVDGFDFGGILTRSLGKLYNKVAVYAPRLWGAFYKLGNICPSIINFFAVKNMKKSIIKLVNDVNPDLIVTVHPGFVGSVIDVLEEIHRDIPVVVIVADLDNISSLWADKRSLYTICPSINSMNSLLKLGVPQDRIKLLGFPVREQFNKSVHTDSRQVIGPMLTSKRLSFLIMNGSQGVGYSSKIARILLKNFDCTVTILAGGNKVLKKKLEMQLSSIYKDRVKVCGFISNVEDYMSASDILILRASPNVLMEAVNLCKPIIVTGAFTGQEEKNPDYVVNNNLGVSCTNIKMLPQTVMGLLAEDGRKLKEIYESQLSYRKPNASRDMAKFFVDVLEEQSQVDYIIDENKVLSL